MRRPFQSRPREADHLPVLAAGCTPLWIEVAWPTVRWLDRDLEGCSKDLRRSQLQPAAHWLQNFMSMDGVDDKYSYSLRLDTSMKFWGQSHNGSILKSLL